jgi:hypothetical protein
MNTTNSDPTVNHGVGIYEMGINSKPRGSKYEPAQILQDAFQSANIDVEGGGAAAAGQYQIFLLVGPRPIRLGDNTPLLTRFGNLISQLGQ